MKNQSKSQLGGAYGGRITGKGTLKTDNLDFEDVYFVNELKFNLFSVSQMCDKKNYVLFTDTECLVLSPNFKLPDENQILLKIPRKDNMYSFDMKNIVPKESLTCLIAKATLDESMLWHRRLGHIKFKNINKLVKDNLVRGLPTKRFENNQTCVACLKGKQHRASSKRRNKTLIEAARTMLADSKLPTTFWAKAVSTACYVVFKLNVVGPLVNIASSYEQDSTEDESEVGLGNITNSYIVLTTPNTRIHKDHPIDNVIVNEVNYSTRRMTKPTFEQGFLSDIETTSIAKALSDSSWVEAMQEELLRQDSIRHSIIKKQKGDILLVQVYVDDIIFGSTNKELCTGFKKLMKDKFQMSSMEILTYLSRLTSTTEGRWNIYHQDKYGVPTFNWSKFIISEALFEVKVYYVNMQSSMGMEGYVIIKSMLQESKASRQVKRGRTPRYSVLLCPLKKVGDEAVHKELGGRMERAATTASSLEAEQDSGSGPMCQDGDVNAQTRFEITSKQSNDPPLSRGYTLGSGDDSMKQLELMELCTQLRNLKIQKMNIKFRGGLLGLKRLHGFLEVTTAQVHNGNYAKCAAGEKITTADYNCLKTFYCQEDKDGLKR
ncbi:ribonuclease H-like domain-containing protein [Tanacetum coccineum]